MVVGQIARDLVLVVDEVPGPGGTAVVRRRREALGGKGGARLSRPAAAALTFALLRGDGPAEAAKVAFEASAAAVSHAGAARSSLDADRSRYR